MHEIPNGSLLARRYRVVRVLGRGGLGITYLANDEVAGIDVALKIVAASEQQATSVVRAEFRILRGLVHPRLCRALDLGTARVPTTGELVTYFTASFVPGETLARWAATTPRWSDCLDPLVDALRALRFLHSIDLVHGDFKPANIVVDTEAQEKRGVLIDLSCCQGFGAAHSASGTPGFIAPEVLRAERLDARTDLFGVGATLRWLRGQGVDVPPNVVKMSKQLLASDPERRLHDVLEVLEVLGYGADAMVRPYLPPSRLLGRRRELERILSLLDDMLQGRDGSRVVVVSGPDGVGRSRLLREAKWEAQSRCDVVEGAAHAPGAVSSMISRALESDHSPSIAHLIRLCRSLHAAGPLVLLLDDADQLHAAQRALWLGLCRALEPSDAVLIVASERNGLELGELTNYTSIELAPLDEPSLREWIGSRLPPSRLSDARRLTGGFPASLHALLARLSAGDLRVSDLERAADATALSAPRLTKLAKLRGDEQRALALLAALGGPLSGNAIERLSLDLESLSRLLAGGWVAIGDAGIGLLRQVDGAGILAALDQPSRIAAHREAASVCSHQLATLSDDDARGLVAARLLTQLCRADAVQEAQEWLAEHLDLARAHPDAWAQAVAQLARLVDDDEVALLAAELAERAGRVADGLARVARLRRQRRASPQVLWLRAAACYLRGGDLARAHRFARLAQHAARDASERAHALDLQSRVQVKRGRFDEALRCALEGLAIAVIEERRAELHDDAGVAATYLSDHGAARNHLQEAAELHGRAGRPRSQARSACYAALNDFRSGDAVAAARRFRQALTIAERCGAADLMTYAAQNLAAANHQLGELAAARGSYELALHLAIALGDLTSVAALRCNLAKLQSDLGNFDRALALAEQAEKNASDASLPLLVVTCRAIAGEVWLWRGVANRAVALFERARAALPAEGATRERAETEAHLADALLAAGSLEAAEQALQRADDAAASLDADDVNAKLALVRGRILRQRGTLDAAVEALELASSAADAAGQRELQAEVAAELWRLYRAQGSQRLAEKHRRLACERWQRTADALPDTQNDRFWRHPLRAEIAADTAPQAEPSPAASTSAREQRLERLLDINKKLNSSLQTDQVLAWAIDYALELTGAERGFVLLAPENGEGEIEIAVARNLAAAAGDQQELFSRGIAQRVLASGQPVITVDAEQDERFHAQQSVHLMQLKSVLSVPICAPEGVIGALYLDHRFKRGIFDSAQVELSSAFADQVAIALTNARLHEELARRQARLDELLRGQAKTIHDLTERVHSQQRVLEKRYDYGAIIGSSPAMQRVFRLLDRVIDSDVPLLIQGESGTGKELVARAIHFNGPRKEGPLVSMNCAALPEQLLESELFGYTRGAFTGATRDSQGLFVAADGGTVFLDEIGEMPPSMQVKLLRVLQEREVTPLGATTPIPIDVRLVSATNRILADEVEEGRFRRDLFYRIGVVEVDLPPLRDRADDLPLLVNHLLERIAKQLGRNKPQVAAAAMAALSSHSWLGNVRELDNVLTGAVLLIDGDTIEAKQLSLTPGVAARPQPATRKATTRGAFEDERRERLLVELQASSWNISATAGALGVSRPTVYRWLQRYGIGR